MKEIDITPSWYARVAASDAPVIAEFIADVARSWSAEKSVFGVAVRAHMYRDLSIRIDAGHVVAVYSDMIPNLPVLIDVMRERLGTERAGEIANARLALLRGDGEKSENGVWGDPTAKAVHLSRPDTDEKILDVSLQNGQTRRFFQHTTLV